MYKLEIDTQKLKLDFKDIINASETATRNTLNTVAFLSRKNSISNINQNFIIRNTFTQRQIQVERVKENRDLMPKIITIKQKGI